MEPDLRRLLADDGDEGRRLDLVIRRHLAGVDRITRTRVQAWIAEGRVALNGRPARRASRRARAGDVVTVAVPDAPERRRQMTAEAIALRVLYEDDHLLVVDKPPGMVVHPTYRHATGTLMNALLWRAAAWPEPLRPSIVGRLDRLTSGLVLVARSAAVHAALQRALASPSSEKDYLAVVHGRVPARGRIDLPLGRDPADQRRVAVDGAGAPSLTRYERLARAGTGASVVSLVRCRLVTGRRHQIRVHLAARGSPIVGDPVYGRRRPSEANDDSGPAAAALRTFPRQALHAWRLSMVHPITRERIVVESPLPEDFAELTRAAGLAFTWC